METPVAGAALLHNPLPRDLLGLQVAPIHPLLGIEVSSKAMHVYFCFFYCENISQLLVLNLTLFARYTLTNHQQMEFERLIRFCRNQSTGKKKH